MHSRITSALLLAAFISLFPAMVRAETWSLRSQFSIANNPSGVWRFGRASSATGTFNLLTCNGVFFPSLVQWFDSSDCDVSAYPLILKNNSLQTHQFGSGTQSGVNPGDIVAHPSPTEYLLVEWVAPVAGNYQVRFLLFGNSGDCGAQSSTVDYALVKVGTGAVATGTLSGLDDSSGEVIRDIGVAAGQSIRLAIGSLGNHSCDHVRIAKFDVICAESQGASNDAPGFPSFGVCPGETIHVFTGDALGAGPMNYRWHFKGQPVFDGPGPGGSTFSGAATKTLTIGNTAIGNIGNYHVVVTTACGQSTSATTSPFVRPDLNRDHAINTLDLTLLLQSFGQTVTPGTAGDANNDGVVNTLDLTTLLFFFGAVC